MGLGRSCMGWAEDCFEGVRVYSLGSFRYNGRRMMHHQPMRDVLVLAGAASIPSESEGLVTECLITVRHLTLIGVEKLQTV